ncbi:MAG: hypothetical protein ACJAZ3_001022 [Sphingobacteriales bacterium]|jgi:hypothetical protein
MSKILTPIQLFFILFLSYFFGLSDLMGQNNFQRELPSFGQSGNNTEVRDIGYVVSYNERDTSNRLKTFHYLLDFEGDLFAEMSYNLNVIQQTSHKSLGIGKDLLVVGAGFNGGTTNYGILNRFDLVNKDTVFTIFKGGSGSLNRFYRDMDLSETKIAISTDIGETLSGVVYYDFKGNELGIDSFQFNGEGFDFLEKIKFTSEQGVVMAGMTRTPREDLSDALICKINSNNQIEWERVFAYKPEWADIYKVLEVLNNGNIFLGGYSYPLSGNEFVNYVKILDKNGNVVVDKFVHIDYQRMAIWNSVFLKEKNEVVILSYGKKDDIQKDDYQIVLTKYNENAEIIWQREIGRYDRHEQGFGLSQTSDGGFLISGSISKFDENYFNTTRNVLVIKVDECGCLVPGCDPNCELTTGTKPTYFERIITDEFEAIYPNPVTDLATFRYNLLVNSEALIQIFDPLGKIVLEREIKDKGELQINVSKFSSGIYHLNVTSSDGLRLTTQSFSVVH